MKKNAFPAFPWIVLSGILMILLSFAEVSTGDFELHFMNSDCMYLPSVYRDLFADHGDIRYWSFNAAPNVFPDMILYFLIQSVTGNFVASSILFSILQYIIIALLADRLIRKIHPDTSEMQRIVLQLILLIPHSFTLVRHDFLLHFQFLSNAYHLGALLNTLIAFHILLSLLQKPLTKKSILQSILFGSFLYIASVSDKLFWVLFMAPAFFLCAFLYIRKRKGILLLTASLTLTTFVMSSWTLNILRSTAPKIDAPFRNMSAEHIPESFTLFMQHMKDLVLTFDTRALFILLVAVSLFLLMLRATRMIIRLFHRSSDEPDLHSSFLVICAGSVLLGITAPVLNGSYAGYDCIRYSYPAMIIALIALAVFCMPLIPAVQKKWLHTGGALVTAVLLLFFLARKSEFSEKWNFRPQQTLEIETLAREYGLRAGVAQYWSAKKNDIFNQYGLKILPVLGTREMYIHANSKGWYLFERGSRKLQEFNFIIIDYPEQITEAHQIFPSDCPVVQHGETRIMLTPSFTFDPETGLIRIKNPS